MSDIQRELDGCWEKIVELGKKNEELTKRNEELEFRILYHNKEIQSLEKEEVDVKVSKEEELFLTLTDSEKVGFRYAKETTWPKVTKQIKRIHKMALPDPEIASIYEEWLTKNIELHGENTKEESTFESNSGEVEEEEFSF